MDKGIIIGAEHEIATRSNLPFVMFRHATSVSSLGTASVFVKLKDTLQSHLFLHHILRYHLESRQVKGAVTFASHYQQLVFFAHALEILLHTVVESEADVPALNGHDHDSIDFFAVEDADPSRGSLLPSASVLPTVIQFLDHFDVALDVVVGCARKTEMTRWPRLFSIVGNPKRLLEVRLMTLLRGCSRL